MGHEIAGGSSSSSSCLLLLQLLLSSSLLISRSLADDCSTVIRSSNREPKNGTFSSPNWPEKYPDNLQCIYEFIALPTERVQIRFLEFEVRGVPPRCVHDYMDVYTQLTSPEDDLLSVPLHGRYCGNDLFTLPHLLISTSNVAVVGFYTDSSQSYHGFLAEYTFIDAGVYYPGEPAGGGVCGQIIDSATLTSGLLLSPTYPGMYPDNVFCYYKIRAHQGERIRLKLRDVNIYSGGTHCPFDYIKIYDGYTNEAAVIGVFCGEHKNLTIFSTGPAMHIEFVTKSGRISPTKKPYVPYWETRKDFTIQRTGFKAEFDIRDTFVKLDFIQGGQHIVGTECDQRILSTGQSNGTITSPNYPHNYPLDVTCHYYIDGLINKENLEKTELYFDMFDMAPPSDGCQNGRLSAYMSGKEIGNTSPDHVFCGRQLPPPLITSNPRLLLRFETHGKPARRGFKARYQFVTDYAIPGTPATDEDCHFTYRSTNRKIGRFNSPRHPTYYPTSVSCTYEFIGQKRENVRITFNSFMLEDRYKNCSTDYLKVYSVATWGTVTTETLVGHYCGDGYIPGPIVSSHEAHMLKVTFHSDDIETRIGFNARYEFIDKTPYSKKCFLNITSGGGDQIRSPNYPLRYHLNSTCEWHIYATPPNQIMLQFAIFSIEGSENGCSQAVLKIYRNSSSTPTYEFCGAKPLVNEVISENQYIRIKFISSSRAVGAKGFLISWTEIMPTVDGVCGGFHCAKSQLCIAPHLQCNKLPNCGYRDKSDEGTACDTSYNDHGALHMILGVVVCLLFLVFIVVCILHRRRKARKRRQQKEIEVRYVTRSNSKQSEQTGTRDSLLLEEHTTKVSVVW